MIDAPVLAPPQSVPMERTTTIRPSEAILLGLLTLPKQGRAGLFDPTTGEACVIGMMAAGFGEDPQRGYLVANGQMPFYLDPPCGCAIRDDDEKSVGHFTATHTLFHLNDTHSWHARSIADWLEQQGL